MRLQRIIMAGNDSCTELYYRGNTRLTAGHTLSFDSYFNLFSYTIYRKYTTASAVRFCCTFKGRAMVELCVYDGSEHVVCSGEFSAAAELSVSLSDLPSYGFIYPKFLAVTDFEFESGGYYSDCLAQNVSCCIAICTYKRENYLLNNISLLRSYSYSCIDRVFVIDNGNTLDSDALSDGFITVMPNRNFGGSGGFTRGLIEAYHGGFSHVLLMDDDIEFNPDIPERMTVFVSILLPEYSRAHFGTAMLSKNEPHIQFEFGGAEWNGRKVCGGKHNIDIRTPESLLANLSGNKINYGAWWCFLMPVSDIPEFGLPLPFFIKMDDVEYGLRTCKENPIITMSGAAVRHDDFDNKYSIHLEYYNVRNQLVLNTLHNNKPFINAIYRLFAVSFKHLVLYRYDCFPLLMKAFDDFLKGADFFLLGNEEQLNREIMQSALKLIPLADMPEWNEQMRGMNYGRANKTLTLLAALTLAGHLIPSFMLKKEVGAAPLSRAGADAVLFRRTVIQYQLKGNTGLLVHRSVKRCISCIFKVFGMFFKLLFCFGKAKKSYLSRKQELCSEDFWQEHLGLL